jgi:CRP-like cAMP-binding protein
MALDDDIRILADVRLFEGFTTEQLRLLAFGSERVDLPAQRRLFREDDEADCAYVVASGSIVLFRETDADHTPLGTATPGAIVGELALIADTRRLTSAKAGADSELIRLKRQMFRRMLEEYPDTAVILYGRIRQQFLELVEEIERIAPRFEG